MKETSSPAEVPSRAASTRPYRPNRIPLKARIVHSLLAMVLIGYALLGASLGELVVPARRGAAQVYGWTVVLLSIAMLSAAAVLLIVVVDHFDTRNNEASYRRIARTFQCIAWAVFLMAIVSTYFRSNRRPAVEVGTALKSAMVAPFPAGIAPWHLKGERDWLVERLLEWRRW